VKYSYSGRWTNSKQRSTWMEDASSLNNHCPTWTWSLFVARLVKYFTPRASLVTSLWIWYRSQTQHRRMHILSSGLSTWTVILRITQQHAISLISWWRVHLIATQASTRLIIRLRRSTNAHKPHLNSAAWWTISKRLTNAANKFKTQAARSPSKTNQCLRTRRRAPTTKCT